MIRATTRTLHVAALVLAGAVLTSAGLMGCKDKQEGKEGKAGKSSVDETALARYADATVALFEKSGRKFIATDVLYFCRSGNLLGESKLAALGLKPNGEEEGRNYCYNVSSNLKKVAISVGDAAGEKQLCQVLDGTGDKVVRSKPVLGPKCEP